MKSKSPAKYPVKKKPVPQPELFREKKAPIRVRMGSN
jgi:hypothetical protein